MGAEEWSRSAHADRACHIGVGDSALKRGLTLGKYAPLHRGHQLVIETALAEMDETLVPAIRVCSTGGALGADSERTREAWTT
jgi:hypothetical protein